MGIRGLENFLELHLRERCRRVSMSQVMSEVNSRDLNTEDGKPLESNTIVVDTQSCFLMMCGCFDWLVEGHGTREWLDRLKLFVRSFQELNIKLVFFFGTLNLVENREMWLEARRKLIAQIHGAIDSPASRRRLPEGFDSVIPSWQHTMSTILGHRLKCTTFVVPIEDYRQEIMNYVQEHKCPAILTQNTDFVACLVDARVLSSKHFVMGNMSTLIYDRLQLATSLGIQVENLPLLAILAGDGSVPCEIIRRFQRCICNEFQFNQISSKILVPAIACYIKKLSQDEDIEATLAHLAVDLFDDSSRVELLRRSYYSYFSKNTSPISKRIQEFLNFKEDDMSTPKMNWLAILCVARYLYQMAEMPYITYSVLLKQIFEGDMAFEDLRYSGTKALTRDQSSFTVLRPLRARLYGILLYEIYREDLTVPVTVQEWCSEDENSFTKPVTVTPIKPEDHPGLLAMWKMEIDISNDLMWRLFLSTVSPSLDIAQWKSFDKKLMLSTLTAYHLFETKYVNETELDAILVTIASSFSYDDSAKLSRLRYGELDFRAVNISIALDRTFLLVRSLLLACGCPPRWSGGGDARMRFEGKVFQIKYAEVVKNKKTDIKSLCENDDDYFELFKRMKNIIVQTREADDLSNDLSHKAAEMVI